MLFSSKSRLFTRFVILSSALIALGGCEFGNKNSTSLTGYDTLSGYYLSLPQTISFDAQVGAGALRTKNGLVGEMPALLKTVMANPTLLMFDDPLQGIGSLRSRLDTGVGFFTRIDAATNTFGASEDLSATVNGCRFVKSVTTSGAFSQLLTQQKVSDVTARGKISLVYDVVFETQGEDSDCAAMRSQFRSCYVDGIGCSTSYDNLFYTGRVQEMFEPFVNAGVITPSEIATTKKVHYHATYAN